MTAEVLAGWQNDLRQGILPLMSTTALQILRKGLADDDPRICLGHTTQPIAIKHSLDEVCDAACPFAFPLWQEQGLETVGEVALEWGLLMAEARDRLRDFYAPRYLIEWVDTSPREEVRRLLGEEIDLELERRKEDDGGQRDLAPGRIG